MVVLVTAMVVVLLRCTCVQANSDGFVVVAPLGTPDCTAAVANLMYEKFGRKFNEDPVNFCERRVAVEKVSVELMKRATCCHHAMVHNYNNTAACIGPSNELDQFYGLKYEQSRYHNANTFVTCMTYMGAGFRRNSANAHIELGSLSSMVRGLTRQMQMLSPPTVLMYVNLLVFLVRVCVW